MNKELVGQELKDSLLMEHECTGNPLFLMAYNYINELENRIIKSDDIQDHICCGEPPF